MVLAQLCIKRFDLVFNIPIVITRISISNAFQVVWITQFRFFSADARAHLIQRKAIIFLLTVQGGSIPQYLTFRVGVPAVLVTWFSLVPHLAVGTSNIRAECIRVTTSTTSAMVLSRCRWRNTTVIISMMEVSFSIQSSISTLAGHGIVALFVTTHRMYRVIIFISQLCHHLSLHYRSTGLLLRYCFVIFYLDNRPKPRPGLDMSLFVDNSIGNNILALF